MSASGNKLIYLAMLVIAAGMAFVWIRNVYAWGPAKAFLVAACVSWLPMQLLAPILEGRSLINPSTQYLSFYIGDLLLLPTVVAVLAYLSEYLPTGWYSGNAWRIGAIGIALVISLAFHLMDQGNYTAAALHSPTKLWHDAFAFPVYSYLLVVQAPALFYSIAPRKGLAVTGAAVCLVAFGLLVGVVDAKRPGTDAHRDYDWSKLQTVS